MGFYTPSWVRRLVKEDHKNIQTYLKSTRNDFRSYIDSRTPFVLWLDISLIRERILDKSLPYIEELASVVSDSRDVTKIVRDLLDKAYVSTINAYATNPRYTKITDTELEAMLTDLSNAQLGNVLRTVEQNFNKTLVVTNVTKKNKSVMLILPKFTTLEFGKVFKEQLKLVVEKTKLLKDAEKMPAVSGMFAGLGGNSSDESEKSRMLYFVNENFAKLQNVGHVEVDVISETERKIMRSQNSPRLLQALVTLPNDIKSFEKLQLKFSKETGQAETRVKIRKRFSGSKLVFEMLVEHGLAVGIPETQKDNLYKATLERAFSIGSGLTASLRKDISILADLETSKSLKQYLATSILETLRTGKLPKPYSSDTTITEKTKVTKTKASLVNTKKSSSTSSLSNISTKKPKVSYSLASLQILLDAQLQQRIKANMGSGSDRKVLNYRTGRLAASAKVERLSQSREGMITAFYSYMRNPYATFSDGGRQEYPKSRDPKLLISQSIKEIMATKVSNRMRAVLV